MRKTKSNTIDKSLDTPYVKKEDKKVYVYGVRKKNLLMPIPYKWWVDFKTIDKIKSLL